MHLEYYVKNIAKFGDIFCSWFVLLIYSRKLIHDLKSLLVDFQWFMFKWTPPASIAYGIWRNVVVCVEFSASKLSKGRCGIMVLLNFGYFKKTWQLVTCVWVSEKCIFTITFIFFELYLLYYWMVSACLKKDMWNIRTIWKRCSMAPRETAVLSLGTSAA